MVSHAGVFALKMGRNLVHRYTCLTHITIPDLLPICMSGLPVRTGGIVSKVCRVTSKGRQGTAGHPIHRFLDPRSASFSARVLGMTLGSISSKRRKVYASPIFMLLVRGHFTRLGDRLRRREANAYALAGSGSETGAKAQMPTRDRDDISQGRPVCDNLISGPDNSHGPRFHRLSARASDQPL